MVQVRLEDVDYIRKYVPEDRLDEAMEMLNQGRSPQYIVGNVDFYGNTIYVDERVLIPRFETELLVEKTILRIQKYFSSSTGIDILDIGTGSGCIAITLAKEVGNSSVIGIDISTEALDVARRNAIENGTNVSFVESDVFSSISSKKFDVIVSNPPYIRYDEEIEDIVLANEPPLALYAADDGLYFYDKILRECRGYLKDRFLIAFEIGCCQGEAVRGLAKKYLGEVDVFIEKDYSNRDRFVFISNVLYGLNT